VSEQYAGITRREERSALSLGERDIKRGALSHLAFDLDFAIDTLC